MLFRHGAMRTAPGKCAKCAHFLYGRESESCTPPPWCHSNDFCGKCFLANEGGNTKSAPEGARRVYEEAPLGDLQRSQGGAQGAVQGRQIPASS
jgi:hypothetical protein